jgi:hypothetical protein
MIRLLQYRHETDTLYGRHGLLPSINFDYPYHQWEGFHQQVLTALAESRDGITRIHRVAGREIPETFHTILRRLTRWGIRSINQDQRHLRSALSRKGRRITIRTHSVVPLDRCEPFLRYLLDLLEQAERWEETRDEDGLLISRVLTWRHPLQRHCHRLLAFALLNRRQPEKR